MQLAAHIHAERSQCAAFVYIAQVQKSQHLLCGCVSALCSGVLTAKLCLRLSVADTSLLLLLLALLLYSAMHAMAEGGQLQQALWLLSDLKHHPTLKPDLLSYR